MSRENQMVYSSVSEEATHLILQSFALRKRFSVLSPNQLFNLWYEKLDHKKVFPSKIQTQAKRRPGGIGAKTISLMKKFGLCPKYPKKKIVSQPT